MRNNNPPQVLWRNSNKHIIIFGSIKATAKFGNRNLMEKFSIYVLANKYALERFIYSAMYKHFKIGLILENVAFERNIYLILRG